MLRSKFQFLNAAESPTDECDGAAIDAPMTTIKSEKINMAKGDKLRHPWSPTLRNIRDTAMAPNAGAPTLLSDSVSQPQIQEVVNAAMKKTEVPQNRRQQVPVPNTPSQQVQVPQIQSPNVVKEIVEVPQSADKQVSVKVLPTSKLKSSHCLRVEWRSLSDDDFVQYCDRICKVRCPTSTELERMCSLVVWSDEVDNGCGQHH